MRSTITTLYDYKQSVIPKELCLWRISDDEITERLKTLSRNHAYEADVDTVQMGDSVACQSESADLRWNRPVMLFYPGRGLCAPEVENACVGAKIGEMKTVCIEGAEVKLTVTRIIRRSNMAVGDELVKAEGIEGVETVEGFYTWYRQTNEPIRALHASYRAASFLLDEIVKNSSFSLDEDEKDKWIWDRVNVIYDALIEAGMDPKIPQEGFDFLTEEQAKEKLYLQNEHFFTEYVAHAYFAEKLTGRCIEDIAKDGLKKVAEENGMTAEAVWKQSGKALVYGKFAYETALEQLANYTKQFLEE